MYAKLPEANEWWIRVDLFPQRCPGPCLSHRSRWWRCPWEIAVRLHKPCTWSQAQGSPTFLGKKNHKKSIRQPLNPENCWTVSMSQTEEGDGFGSVPTPALRTSHSIPLASGRSNHWVTGANQRETPPLPMGEMELS